MSLTRLATFRTSPEFWEALKAKASEQGINVSALLKTLAAAYLDGRIDFDPLVDIQATENRIDTAGSIDSQAKTSVAGQPEHSIDKTLHDRLSAIEVQLNSIENRLSNLETAPKPSHPSENRLRNRSDSLGAVSEPKQNIASDGSFSPNTQKPVSEGLTQTRLCDLFKIDSSNLKRTADRLGVSVQEFLRRETGWQHDPTARAGNSKSGLWFPPVE